MLGHPDLGPRGSKGAGHRHQGDARPQILASPVRCGVPPAPQEFRLSSGPGEGWGRGIGLGGCTARPGPSQALKQVSGTGPWNPCPELICAVLGLPGGGGM